MFRLGIPLPPGFVILTKTFDKFIKITKTKETIENIIKQVDCREMASVEKASEEIAAIIVNQTIPKEITDEIEEKFKELNTKYVAVRSSATSEDSNSAAWAGQLDSFLNTNSQSLLLNIKLCWSSLFSSRAIFYRFDHKLKNKKISVAVVIQKMVEAQVSGVAFSVHPITKDYNQIIIEAGFGLGEAIVSGKITPDSYIITKEPLVITQKIINTKKRGYYLQDSDQKNVWIDIPESAGAQQCLNDQQIKKLAKLVLDIEKHYGFPCDIEWGLEDGQFFILQSRPITTLGKKEK
jgi:pyruvate,water dikinase